MVKYGDILVKVLSIITKAAMLQTENHSKKQCPHKILQQRQRLKVNECFRNFV